MKLIESFCIKGQILESQRENLPDGVLCRVLYPICFIGQKNANNRIYESAVWEKVLSSPEIKEKISKRSLFGHAEHPNSVQSDLQLTSHVIVDMYIKDNVVYQVFDVLDTPTGRIVDCLLRAGCNVGVSTRAEGDLEEVKNGDEKIYRVVPESYHYVTTDFTADPSTFGSAPLDVKRNIVTAAESIFNHTEASEGDKKLGQLILETISKEEKEKNIDRETILENHRKEITDKINKAILEEWKQRVKDLIIENLNLEEKIDNLNRKNISFELVLEEAKIRDNKKNEKIEQLSKNFSEVIKINETLENKNKSLEESLKEKEEKINRIIQEKEEILKEAAKEKEKQIQEAFVKAYIQYKIRNSGLPQSSLTLLENCRSIDEVDSIYNQIIENFRKNTLHSFIKEKKEIEPPQKPEDSISNIINYLNL